MSSKKGHQNERVGEGERRGGEEEPQGHTSITITRSNPSCSLQNIPQFPQGNRMMQVFCKCDEFMAALMEVRVSLIPRLPLF